MDLQTTLVHPPSTDREPTGASSTPIYQSATFAISDDNRWDYSRSGNPTREVLENQLAILDDASHALAYSSGVAALAAVFRLVRPGGHIVCSSDVYGGTFRLLDLLGRDHDWRVQYVDTTDTASLQQLRVSPPDLFFVEVPSNPLLRATDLERLRASVGPKTVIAVDHSMLSPVLCRPLNSGADIAVQSGTKLLGGHGDLTAGVVCTSDSTTHERLRFRQNAEGTALSPFDSWLLIRGLQTLPLRVRQQVETARSLVTLLADHPAVESVFYPANACQQGPVFSFTTGSVNRSQSIVSNTSLFRTTVSFGSVFSSISLPCEMSHASVPDQLRGVSAFPRDLVRVAVGIEVLDDVWADLSNALGGRHDHTPTRFGRHAGVPV